MIKLKKDLAENLENLYNFLNLQQDNKHVTKYLL